MPGLSLVTRGMWVMRVQMWRYYGFGMMPTVTGRVAARHDAGGVRSIGFRLGMVWRVGGWVGQQLQASGGQARFFFFPRVVPAGCSRSTFLLFRYQIKTAFNKVEMYILFSILHACTVCCASFLLGAGVTLTKPVSHFTDDIYNIRLCSSRGVISPTQSVVTCRRKGDDRLQPSRIIFIFYF